MVAPDKPREFETTRCRGAGFLEVRPPVPCPNRPRHPLAAQGHRPAPGRCRKLCDHREPFARSRDRAAALTFRARRASHGLCGIDPDLRHCGRRGHHVDLLQIYGTEGRRLAKRSRKRPASMPRRRNSKPASPSSNGSSPIGGFQTAEQIDALRGSRRASQQRCSAQLRVSHRARVGRN